MQTFLPYPSYVESARALDSRRLNKQRVECKQILKAIFNPESGWSSHPATKMWSYTPGSLCVYALAICDECDARGIRDNVNIRKYFQDMLDSIVLRDEPRWLGEEAFHLSHRSNLARKDPMYYSWSVDHNLPYVWPDP
jgi:hypothetical protein